MLTYKFTKTLFGYINFSVIIFWGRQGLENQALLYAYANDKILVLCNTIIAADHIMSKIL